MIQTKGNKFNRVCLDMHIEKKNKNNNTVALNISRYQPRVRLLPRTLC